MSDKPINIVGRITFNEMDNRKIMKKFDIEVDPEVREILSMPVDSLIAMKKENQALRQKVERLEKGIIERESLLKSYADIVGQGMPFSRHCKLSRKRRR